MTNCRIMFLRNKVGRPIGCLAILLDRQMQSIKYQLSVLNPLDIFNKEIAKNIAIGRLDKKPFHIKMEPNTNINWTVMSHLFNNKNAPTRARKAAKHWFNTIISFSFEN